MAEETHALVGSSTAVRAIEAEIDYAARSDAKVLITGESGVGKEVVAYLVHRRSRRARTPLVTLNCAGLPDTLLESALFGHLRGSFTDAHQDRVGLLEMAHGGTVFLDEIGEMSLRMQTLLLRFLETGELQRIGVDRAQHPRVDVRVIAATNRDLPERIAAGAFREDLYYRLNVIHIPVAPLRERRGDIPELLRHFVKLYAERHHAAPPDIAPDALERLTAYRWPGNVRELKNVVERLIVRSGERSITASDLPAEVLHEARRGEPARGVVDELFDQMVAQHESFWTVVQPAFTARDLTRADLRALVRRGLAQTGGSYKALLPLFNMDLTDTRRFLAFLRKHECYVEVARPVRSAR